jgi:hypothetical protein
MSIRDRIVGSPWAWVALFYCQTTLVATVKAEEFEGTARVSVLEYPSCIELKNASTRVVLGHDVGGRVLIYERNGVSVLYLSPKEAQWKSVTQEKSREVTAGRLDIGPELLSKRGPTIWSGTWQSEIVGPRTAKLTSQIDPQSNLQVTRVIRLAKDSSRLSITQTVTNHGPNVSRHGFWSRAFAVHGGIGIIPVTPESSRYPNLYTMHAERAQVNLKPVDPNVRRQGDFLILAAPPAFPKLGFDSHAGWVAYLTPQNQLFVHKYPVFPDRVYAEATGMNLSLWYPEASRVPACEIEPIGPMETLQPNQQASFTVDWWLLESKFPPDGNIDAELIAAQVATECRLD